MPEHATDSVAPVRRSHLIGEFDSGADRWSCCSCCETPGELGVCYFNTTPNRHIGPCKVCDPDA